MSNLKLKEKYSYYSNSVILTAFTLLVLLLFGLIFFRIFNPRQQLITGDLIIVFKEEVKEDRAARLILSRYTQYLRSDPQRTDPQPFSSEKDNRLAFRVYIHEDKKSFELINKELSKEPSIEEIIFLPALKIL